MSGFGLRGLPQFLTFLTTYPEAQQVVSSLRTGVLSSVGARTATLWSLMDGDLVMVAQDGHTRDEADRYSVLPGNLDLLMWRAIRSGEALVTDENDTVMSQFSSVDEESWSRTLARVHTVSVVRAPLMHCGQPVGALGLLVDQVWNDDAAALLEVVASMLGLWLTSPDSGAREAATANRTRATSFRLAFTDRQKQVLHLVEQDASTPEIAIALNQSESTIKQDLQQVMRALNTRNRAIAAARARELGLI